MHVQPCCPHCSNQACPTQWGDLNGQFSGPNPTIQAPTSVYNATDDHYFPKISSWSGLGVVTVQSTAQTTYTTYATGDGIWALVGTIAGAYGGM